MLIDIALDAFGSDKAPEPEIRGAILACRTLPVRVHLIGPEPELRDLLEKLAATRVIQPTAGQRLLRSGKTLQHVHAQGVQLFISVDSNIHGLGILGKSNTRELPTGIRAEKVSVTGAHVAGGRHAGAAAQHVLAGHEFPVVLTDRVGSRTKTRIRGEGTAGPFPDVAEQLLRTGSQA